MKTKVIFRVDGNSETGMGHIVRCVALAEIIKNDFEIVFAIQNSGENLLQIIKQLTSSIILLPMTTNYVVDANNFIKNIAPENIVVLDGYYFKTDYQEAVMKRNCKLVCIDDLNEWPQLSDVVINYSEGVKRENYQAKESTRIYTGLRYVILRNQFLNASKSKNTIDAVKKVFVSMGAADKNNLTEIFTTALLNLEEIEEIHLMIGGVNKNKEDIKLLSQSNKKIKTHIDISADELKKLLQQCDVAICSASTIALECCSVGIGIITGFTAQNQFGILNSLKKYEAAFDIGNLNEAAHGKLNMELKNVFHQKEILNAMIANQRRMIDGKSPDRLLAVFKKLDKQNLRFRFAQASDVDLYFSWTNDALVRSNSFNQEEIKYEDHVKWFQARLNTDNCFFYLFFNLENVPVGQVRIEKIKDEILIGISIDKNFRGKSFGVEMIESTCVEFFQKHPTNIIYAYIKTGNVASGKIFQSAGFIEDKDRSEEGYIKYRFHKKLES